MRDLRPRPQMCQGHEVTDNNLTWRFRLRDGLTFHDGEPVRAADCIASIARWMKRDGFGQRIEAQLNEMRATDDLAFEIRLQRPFPLMLEALAKPSANVCFVMPERIAKTDAFTQISDYTGSGPFRFFARNGSLVPWPLSPGSRPMGRGRRSRASLLGASRPTSTGSSGTLSLMPALRPRRSSLGRRIGGSHPPWTYLGCCAAHGAW